MEAFIWLGGLYIIGKVGKQSFTKRDLDNSIFLYFASNVGRM